VLWGYRTPWSQETEWPRKRPLGDGGTEWEGGALNVGCLSQDGGDLDDWDLGRKILGLGRCQRH
jgi:hypothetical protein